MTKSALLHIGKKYLCTAFAIAVALPAAGCGFGGNDNAPAQNLPLSAISRPISKPLSKHPYAPAPLSNTFSAFGQKAAQAPVQDNPFGGPWHAMLKKQHALMQIPKDVRPYENFLKSVNHLRGEPLKELAVNVNGATNFEMTYRSDESVYGQPDYWATPVEAAYNRAGDCEDFAFLQYFTLRHLGVPEDRLFIATVNAENQKTSPDHGILLLNTAAAGAPPGFIAFGDGGPVMNGNSRTVYRGAYAFTFFDAFNQDSFWKTALGSRYDSKVPTAANPAPKMG